MRLPRKMPRMARAQKTPTSVEKTNPRENSRAFAMAFAAAKATQLTMG